MTYNGPKLKRLNLILNMGIEKGSSVSYGLPRRDAVVEEVTENGYIKVVGNERLMTPGLIFACSPSEKDQASP